MLKIPFWSLLHWLKTPTPETENRSLVVRVSQRYVYAEMCMSEREYCMMGNFIGWKRRFFVVTLYQKNKTMDYGLSFTTYIHL